MARTDDDTRDESLHGAAHDVVADAAPAQARDEFTERVFAAFEDDDITPAGGGAAGALQRAAPRPGDESRAARRSAGDDRVRDRRRAGQARGPDPDPDHPRPGRARFGRVPGRVRAARLPRRGRDHDRRALRQPDRVLPAGPRGRAGAVQPARACVRSHPPAEHGRTHHDAARRVRVARHERHRDPRALRAVGDDLVARERHADRGHARRDVRLLVAADAPRADRVRAGAAAVPLLPASPARRPTTRSGRASAT